MDEVMTHPHNAERRTFGDSAGVVQPAPAPRFDGVDTSIPETDMTACDYDTILEEWS